MPMSCAKGCVTAPSRAKAWTYLENMFERIRDLLPFVDEMFVSFAHSQVQILIRFPADDAVMLHAFLVVRESTPAVSMQRAQERKACPIEARVQICRCRR